MFRLIVLLLLPTFGHATTLNHTLIQQCASSFIGCDNFTTNCTQTFDNCLSSAEIPPKKPQACYQSEAAAFALSTVFWASIGLVAGSIVLSNSALIVQFLFKRFGCCTCMAELLEVVTKEVPPADPTATLIPAVNTIDLLKSITAKTMTTLGTVLTGIITYVSAGWIYNLWQLWTSKEADCQYYLDQQ